MIKSHPLAVFLVTALFVSALASSWFCFWWFLGARELESMTTQHQSLIRISSAMQALANDAVEYSRRNPALEPVLHQFDLKARPAAPPAVTQPPLRPAR